jgi:anaerobic glycerol-3-phosphate dehydrogenase
VAYGNLAAAGAVLAGNDDGAERGGIGMGLVTGWVAGRTASRAVSR